MNTNRPDPKELVMTQAEVPPPPAAGADLGVDPEALLEVEQLASRVGGLDRLRQLVDVLIQQRK